MLNIILLAVPFFLLFIGVEYWIGRRKGQDWYNLHDTITNFSTGIGSQVAGLLSKALLVGAYLWIYENWAFVQQTPTWYSALFALLGFDFIYYWAHRWSHEVNFLWGAHVVHHQSEEYNLSVALRQSWIHNLLAFVLFLPLPFLGFEPTLFFSVAAFVTLFQFWVHTKAVDKLPRWFEYIFNTPSHHRVHHAVNPKYIDKNHAAVFILWDRIFGTFKEEEESPTFGITTPLSSFNPTWANLHYYKEMWQLAKITPRFSDKIRILWARPGWRPNELGGQLPIPEVADDYKKYDKELAPALELYVILQFLAVLGGTIAYMSNFDSITNFYQWAFAATIVLSIMICGGIIERKKWVAAAEYIRLFVILGALNSYYYFWYIDWLQIMAVASTAAVLASAAYFTWSWRRAALTATL
jgi:sterol desaturase/sphingolipid hydroxylase (fatty acid hydroxylase superfamily)